MSTGHDGFPPRPSVEGCPRVTVGGISVHCEGQAWAPHSSGGSTHVGYLAQGAPHVTIGGRGVGRVGDPISCGDKVAQGCKNVTVGNCGGGDFARDMLFKSLTDQKDKLILCLPEMEAAEAERIWSHSDRQGWIYAHECILKWREKKAYVIGSNPDLEGKFDNGGQPPYLVDWKWLYNYYRFQSALSELLVMDYLFLPDAKANLTRFLKEENAFTGGGKAFDHIKLTSDSLRARAFQGKPMEYNRTGVTLAGERIVPDGMTVFLGQVTLYAVAAGETRSKNGGYSVIVNRVGVFIHDAFEFGGDQWLGNWECTPNFMGFSSFDAFREAVAEREGAVLGLPSRLDNSDFRNFRQRTGYGCDFRVMCIPHIVWEGEYSYDAP